MKTIEKKYKIYNSEIGKDGIFPVGIALYAKDFKKKDDNTWTDGVNEIKKEDDYGYFKLHIKYGVVYSCFTHKFKFEENFDLCNKVIPIGNNKINNGIFGFRISPINLKQVDCKIPIVGGFPLKEPFILKGFKKRFIFNKNIKVDSGYYGYDPDNGEIEGLVKRNPETGNYDGEAVKIYSVGQGWGNYEEIEDVFYQKVYTMLKHQPKSENITFSF